jgi:hypothetical protein
MSSQRFNIKVENDGVDQFEDLLMLVLELNFELLKAV